MSCFLSAWAWLVSGFEGAPAPEKWQVLQALPSLCVGFANVLCVLEWLGDRQSREVGRNTFIKGSKFGLVDLTPLSKWRSFLSPPQASSLLLQPHTPPPPIPRAVHLALKLARWLPSFLTFCWGSLFWQCRYNHQGSLEWLWEEGPDKASACWTVFHEKLKRAHRKRPSVLTLDATGAIMWLACKDKVTVLEETKALSPVLRKIHLWVI